MRRTTKPTRPHSPVRLASARFRAMKLLRALGLASPQGLAAWAAAGGAYVFLFGGRAPPQDKDR